MTLFVNFMNGAFGRSLRAVLGIALIYYGAFVFGGTTGWVIAAIGLLPIALRLWGHCLLEPFVPRAHVAP